jgi:N-acetylneuraminate synthase
VSTLIIAEVGVNHNGDLGRALELVDRSAAAGADAVKFQTFRADALVHRDAPKAEYQIAATGAAESQYDMLRKLELSEDAHRKLASRCAERRIEFLSTPFDEDSADLLGRIGVARYKVGSGEITNLFLLRHVAAKRRPVILSTGMSTVDEVDAAVKVLRTGGSGDVTLLHCVSDYPTRPEDVNLRVMGTLRNRFGVPVGLSDHTTGIAVSLAAAALGAAVIEKHVTLDRGLPGPDHRASLEPGELAELVKGVRQIEVALGSPEKTLTAGERSTVKVARRSLVAAQALAAGAVVERRHLAAKRPGTGISPMDVDKVVGRTLKRDVEKDAILAWDDLG